MPTSADFENNLNLFIEGFNDELSKLEEDIYELPARQESLQDIYTCESKMMALTELVHNYMDLISGIEPENVYMRDIFHLLLEQHFWELHPNVIRRQQRHIRSFIRRLVHIQRHIAQTYSIINNLRPRRLQSID